jgi:hypothetical protein
MLLFVTRHCQLLTQFRIFFSLSQNIFFYFFPTVTHISTQSSTDTLTNAYDENDSHTDTLTKASTDTDENNFGTGASDWALWALEAVGKQLLTYHAVVSHQTLPVFSITLSNFLFSLSKLLLFSFPLLLMFATMYVLLSWSCCVWLVSWFL